MFFVGLTMNIIPTITNNTFTSQQHELNFRPKRTFAFVDETSYQYHIAPNKKARIMSMVSSSGRWSLLGTSPVHSQSEDRPILLPCCSSGDTMIVNPNSMLLYKTFPPMLNAATFREDNDGMTTTTTISTINSPTPAHVDWVELQIKFLRALKKLNKSMQRTDQSRMFFVRTLQKQQHRLPLYQTDHNDGGLRYFTSPEWYQKQQYRRQFAKIVHYDCLYRTVF